MFISRSSRCLNRATTFCTARLLILVSSSRKGCSRLETAMQGIGDVSELDHLRHAYNILSCSKHVNRMFGKERFGKLQAGCSLRSRSSNSFASQWRNSRRSSTGTTRFHELSSRAKARDLYCGLSWVRTLRFHFATEC